MLTSALMSLAFSQDYVISRQQGLVGGLSAKQWKSHLGGSLVPLIAGTAFVRMPGGPAAPGFRARGRAALLTSSDPTAALSHGSVLRLNSCRGTPMNDPEHLTTATGGWHPRVGVQRHCMDVTSADLTSLDGLPATRLTRALKDCVRSYDREHAVSIVDSALQLALVDDASVSEIGFGLGLMRRGWLTLVDRCSESPLETRARLFFGDHKLDWQSQVSMHLDGFGTVRADFLIGRRLVVECDGVSVHDAPQARFRDRAREDALRNAGYEVLRLTWGDLELRPMETLGRILAALARCR